MSVRDLYEGLVASRKVERDPAQEALIAKYVGLEQRLAVHRSARRTSPLGWLFGGNGHQRDPVQGLYIYGDVGRGKTMLMDLFFEASPIVRKRRLHFHGQGYDLVERPLIRLTLSATRGNQIKAAQVLGLNRNTLRKKIRDLDIQVFRSGS